MNNWIQNTLKKHKLRNSTARNEIIDYMQRSCRMFQAQDIVTALPHIDKVTIYRTITTLSELNIVHPTMVRGGSQYYELHTPEHHHHAMCKSCTAQECVDCSMDQNKYSHHTVFYSYTCTDCN